MALSAKRVQHSAFGGIGVLEVATFTVAAPAPDQIRVRVEAVAINPIDYKRREGKLKLVEGSKLPLGILHDVAGVVEAVGSGVNDFEVGDRVFARSTEPNTYAEYCLVKAKVAARMPNNLSFAQAAGIPLAGMTALQALRAAGIKKGDNVFISGGAGGVGTFAIQLAKVYFAASKVTVTCSGAKAELCRGLGADEVVDYTKLPKGKAFERMDRQFDVVFDTTGEAADMMHLAKKGTTVVSVARLDSRMAPKANFLIRLVLDFMARDVHRSAKANDVTYLFWRLQLLREDLVLLGGLVAQGQMRTVIDSTFKGLEEHKKAFEKAEQGRPAGKVVIVLE